MEALLDLFDGRLRLAEKPKDTTTRYTVIFFMTNHGMKENVEIRQAVRAAFGFSGPGMYFHGWINFTRDQLALMRQFRLKHKHEGSLRVVAYK